MFTIDMLPGGRGDSLWIEYGDPARPKRILIDGGIPNTYDEGLGKRVLALPEDDRRFELIVVSHVDLDHIGGILELFRAPPDGFEVGDIWFNAYEHLDPGTLGAKQGESLSALLEAGGYTWNDAFGGGPASVGEADEAVYHEQPLDGGMRVVMLGPTQDRLRRLEPEWRKTIERAGMVPGEAGPELEGFDPDEGMLGDGFDLDDLANARPKSDTLKANGSSITLLLEHDGKRCLFSGDGHSKDVKKAVEAIALDEGETELAVNAWKIAHHGGSKNTHVDLVQKVVADAYLLSTDGSYYRHPDDETVARIVVHGQQRAKPHLFFNHRLREPRYWEDPDNPAHARVRLEYPDAGVKGLRVDL